MIQQRVTIQFMPVGGTATDAVVAANQTVFIDLTAGTLGPARTNASGLLVTTTGAGTAIPLDDSRQYLIVVLDSAPAATPSATSATSVRVQSARINVVPNISIRIALSAGPPAARLACKLTIGGTSRNVTTSAGGFLVSNEGTAGAITVSSPTKALRTTGAATPNATLSMTPTTLTRGATARIQAAAPAGAIDFQITEWSYALSHTNPDGAAQAATITRPAAESPATFQQNWEGEMCASGTVSLRFVTGTSLRAAGAGAVAVSLTAADPFVSTFSVTVDPRSWTTPLTQNPETTFNRAISTIHDTGEHAWDPSAHYTLTPTTIGPGPNRGCKYVGSVNGLAFTSSPRINSLVANTASPFMSAQGTARVTAPPGVLGQIIPTTFYTTNAAGDVTITNLAGLLTHLGLPSTAHIGFVLREAISAADLLEGTRRHEHTHPSDLSHKANCLKALRALEPMKFIEAFVDAPAGAAVAFGTKLSARVQLVANVGPIHTIVDESATQTAGQVRLVAGQQIPDVNPNGRPIWNPATNRVLT